jgi:hypothetical protein
MSIEAFQVTAARKVGPAQWVLSGRAYSDIGIGDRLQSAASGPAEFVVSEIVTYGKVTDLLSKMMTGSIKLTSLTDADHSKAQMLYRSDSIV